MDLHHHALEQIVINVSGLIGKAGALTTVGSGGAGLMAAKMTANPEMAGQVVQWSTVGIWSGIAIGVIGYLTQSFYSHRRDRRETQHREQEKELMAIQKQVLQEKLDVMYSVDEHGRRRPVAQKDGEE